MSFFVRYVAYPEKIGEVRMELGTPDKYQTIQAVEKVPILIDGEEEPPKEYEIMFKVVDNSTNSITNHKMSREELSDYIAVLKQVLVQTQTK